MIDTLPFAKRFYKTIIGEEEKKRKHSFFFGVFQATAFRGLTNKTTAKSAESKRKSATRKTIPIRERHPAPHKIKKQEKCCACYGKQTAALLY